LKINFLGKSLSGQFTIPSGIVTCSTSIIQLFLDFIPQIGVITTKSIGPEPRLGYREPILAQYKPGSFVNAVGLTNPGADASVKLMAQLRVPEDRFLLISIFGGSVSEYVEVARKLGPHADGLELNLSCPHAKGYGMAMGQDPDLVREIVSAVKDAVDVPVVPKLTPNVPNIGEIALAAAEGGADAICAINTMGPELYTFAGHPVLSNGKGGVSGKDVLPTALSCIAEIHQAVDLPLIGCGGVSSAENVRDIQQAGASIIGIGSALIGMTTAEIAGYFKTLEQDLIDKNDAAEAQVRYDIDMSFNPVTLVSNERITGDISILTFDRKVEVKAGEFIFLWLPGLGEKPFSVLLDDPFKLVVISLGQFTQALVELKPGVEAYYRGPYGIPVDPAGDQKIVAVAGGTGLAAVYQIARDFGNADIFIGARSRERLYFLAECETVGNLHIATDDGSEGYKGLVTELLEEYLAALSKNELSKLLFYNCGPEPMVHAAEAVQRRFCEPAQIQNAIDYLTKCGVGICGACGAPDGRRLCVDGPFLEAKQPLLGRVAS